MDKFQKILRTNTYSVAILFYLFTVVFPVQPWFHPVTSVLAIVALAISIPVASRIVKTTGLLFLIGGSVIALQSGVSLSSYYLLFGKMLDLLSLFTLIPFMAIPIQVGDYSSAILQFISKFAKNDRNLFRSISFIGYGLGSVMNLAALPMTYYSIQPVMNRFRVADQDRFLSMSITRGYSMPLVWSPVAAMVGAVVQVTHSNLFWIMPFSMFLSVMGIILGFLLAPKPTSFLSDELAASMEMNTALSSGALTKNSLFKLGQMVLAIILFIVSMAVIEHNWPLTILSVVTLLSLPFSALWALLLAKGAQFCTYAKTQVAQLYKMQDQFAVFLCAGFFVTVLKEAGAAPHIDQFLVHLSHLIGTTWFLIFIPLIPVLLSMLGLHPLVSIALLGESLNPHLIGIRPEWVAVAYLGGGVTTFVLSPFNATLTLMSGIVNRSPFELMKWNAPFCALYLALVILLVTLLHLLWP